MLPKFDGLVVLQLLIQIAPGPVCLALGLGTLQLSVNTVLQGLVHHGYDN